MVNKVSRKLANRWVVFRHVYRRISLWAIKALDFSDSLSDSAKERREGERSIVAVSYVDLAGGAARPQGNANLGGSGGGPTRGFTGIAFRSF